MKRISYPHVQYLIERGISENHPISIDCDGKLYGGTIDKFGYTPDGFQYIELKQYPHKFLFCRIKNLYYDDSYVNDTQCINYIDFH